MKQSKTVQVSLTGAVEIPQHHMRRGVGGAPKLLNNLLKIKPFLSMYWGQEEQFDK